MDLKNWRNAQRIDPGQPERRGFLIAAGTGAAAGVAVLACAANLRPQPATGRPPRSSRPSGYRETEHIRHYYKTTET
jgi:hypothetical protein